MTERSAGRRGLATGLAVTGLLGAGFAATSCSAHPTMPRASCGQAVTHDLSGATQVVQADAGALSCFATAARHCRSASIAITEMGVDTGTGYVFAIVPGGAGCPATEWSQFYSANGGGSTGPVAVTRCSATAGAGGVLLGCAGQQVLIPATVTRMVTLP